jgi:peptide deformylase
MQPDLSTQEFRNLFKDPETLQAGDGGSTSGSGGFATTRVCSDSSPQERRILEGLEYFDLQRKPKAIPMRYFPDEILNQVCGPVESVTPELRALATDMLMTMMARGGVGLAAPQVGRRVCLFVADVGYTQGVANANPMVFFNPTVRPVSYEAGQEPKVVESSEGCLSFPGIKVKVPRHADVQVSALDLDGNRFELTCAGLLARVVQHEYDHLLGLTIAGRLSRMQRNDLRKALKKLR